MQSLKEVWSMVWSLDFLESISSSLLLDLSIFYRFMFVDGRVSLSCNCWETRWQVKIAEKYGTLQIKSH